MKEISGAGKPSNPSSEIAHLQRRRPHSHLLQGAKVTELTQMLASTHLTTPVPSNHPLDQIDRLLLVGNHLSARGIAIVQPQSAIRDAALIKIVAWDLTTHNPDNALVYAKKISSIAIRDEEIQKTIEFFVQIGQISKAVFYISLITNPLIQDAVRKFIANQARSDDLDLL